MAEYINRESALINCPNVAHDAIKAIPSVDIRFVDEDHVWIKNKQFVSICNIEERKTGKWIDKGVSYEEFPHRMKECSVCGYNHGNSNWGFCPVCGARMEGE